MYALEQSLRGTNVDYLYLENTLLRDKFPTLKQDIIATIEIDNNPRNFISELLDTSQVVGNKTSITNSNLEIVEPIRGTNADDTLIGGTENDRIRGLGGNDNLLGLDGRDFLAGGDGNDDLQGNLDQDTLSGGEGDDTLIGGGKIDILYGGEGRDTFVLQSNRGKDFIMDFELGVDILRLSDGLTLDSLTFENDLAGTGTLIRNSEGNAVAVLKNIPLGSLTDEFEDPNEPELAFEGFPYLSNFVELSDGLNMHYLDEGTGDPIVLLHGVPTSSFLWRNIIPELAERGRVIVPDLINFGFSDKTEAPLDFVEHGELVTEFIETLDLENITFVGHDWGGPIGLSYAVDHPENVEAFAFFESPIVALPNVEALESLPGNFLETFINPANSETNIIENNLFIEGYLFDPEFGGIAEPLSETEQAVYREPFLNPEAREQLFTFPQELPLLDTTGHPIYDPDGVGGLPPEPVPNIEEFSRFAQYIATTDIPRLLVLGTPGFTPRELILPLASQIPGIEIAEVGDEDNPAFHFIQEDAPEELSTVLAEWIDSTVNPPEPDSSTTIKITIENLAPERGIGIAQLWVGFHDGSFDLYNVREQASLQLETLAEDGITGLEPTIPGLIEEAIAFGAIPENFPTVEETIAGQFASSPAGMNGGIQNMLFTDNREPPFFLVQNPGETISTTITLEGDIANHRFFNYGAMLFPTNDGFIANDEPIEIFDAAGNFLGADFTILGSEVLDAGTEVNDEDPMNVVYTLDVIGNSVDENGIIQQFPGFLPSGSGGILDFEIDGETIFPNADFTVPDYQVARITITAVEEPETPEEPIFGTVDDDILEVNGSEQLVFAGAGNDTIDASNSQGNNRIFAGSGNDTLILGTGDVLAGGEGEDRFFSQTGGNNRITGGADGDQFWIAVAELPDTPQIIEDLELDIDVIGIVGIGASSTVDLNFNQNGDNAIISFGSTDLAIFSGIDANQLENNASFRFI
ncbi:MAG: alpha/beta fold hydrolase [Xenococcaceae cyanobacterium MO_167.B27]|nr:alpha/beta fold hydrolase [Xenococcaceae cyanobacterium MO_167.B27]